MKYKLALFVILAALPLALAVMPVGETSASQPSATIKIRQTAHLLGDGTVDVTVTYTCQPGFGFGGFVQASIEQTGAAGTNSEPATCDDRSHQETINITTFAGPFSKGSADASAGVASPLFNSDTAQAQVNIR